MKRILNPVIPVLAAICLSACTKESAPTSEGTEIIITATGPGSMSRTAIQSDGTSVWWSPGDRISVFYGAGSTPATFTGQNASAAATATFKGTLNADESLGLDFYGIYPVDESNAVSSDGLFTLRLKDSQTALSGTFAPDLFPVVAVSGSRELTFLNVAGGIKFSVADEGIEQIEFRSNGGEPLAGIATIEADAGATSVKSVTSASPAVSVSAPAGGFVPGENYYAVLLPGSLSSGITITLMSSSGSGEIVSDKAYTVRPGVFGRVGELKAPAGSKGPVVRVWGKYTTSDAVWNEYLGAAPASDRNVTLDDDCIYIAEANKTRNLWAINLSDGSLRGRLPATTVKEEGTFYLSCARVINLDGQPVVTACNMTEDASAVPVYFYVWENGTDSDPTCVKLDWGASRLGDTYTYWGASATNSVDGKGLSRGLLYFGGMFTGDGIRIWHNEWKKGSLPSDPKVQVRYGFDNGYTCAGAFFPYPGSKDSGIWAPRDPSTPSVYARAKAKDAAAGIPDLWTAEGNQLANTVCTPIESGYYKAVAAYQFFDFGGKRYIAYAKQVSDRDGRVIVMQGDTTDSWEDIMTEHNVIYQASMQDDVEFFDGDYHPEMEIESIGLSNNLGMDLSIRVMSDCVYIACVKQGIGLSLFKLSAN